MGKGGGEEKIIFRPPARTPPLHQPFTGQASIQDGGIEPIYLAFRSEITPALQAKELSTPVT